MLDLERFIDDCRRALTRAPVEPAIREVVARAVSAPAPLLQALGEPKRAQLQTLHRSAELTILNVIWAPGMSVMPHDHRMWAVIGIYTGREDNVFWRRVRDAPAGLVEVAGERTLEAENAVSLGRDIIHSVHNPLASLTGALHVYGGDFFATERSEWNPETLLERPYDVQKALRMFEDASGGKGHA